MRVNIIDHNILYITIMLHIEISGVFVGMSLVLLFVFLFVVVFVCFVLFLWCTVAF